jgi:hypothetical protein
MRREIPPLRRAPSLRGGKTKTRGFGRDDVMGEMASWRVLSAAAVRRATTNKRYGAGRRPAVRKPKARCGESVMLLASSCLSLLRTVAQAKGAGERSAVRKAAAAVENGSDGNELRACAGEPFLCQDKAAPFEAQGKRAV